MNTHTFPALALAIVSLAGLAGAQQTLPVKDFGKTPDGTAAKLYTLKNADGLEATVSDFGATLVAVIVPDKDGKMADVAHGFDSVEGYAAGQNPYFGATVGRYGNRIANAKFTLGGEEYELAKNNGPNHLHGGPTGFNKRMWTVKEQEAPGSITLEYVSADGEEGFPGKLTATVTYTLNDDNELIWEARATTDSPTIVNLVHHTYWNLSGEPTSSVNDHLLTLHADKFLPTDDTLIPTGELRPVEGTPMDFTKPTVIGKRIDADFEPLKVGGGYDHCWVLKGAGTEGLHPAARLEDPESGRVMELSTNQPGVQFYGGNFLNVEAFQGDNPPGKEGVAYPHRSACCLETQKFPDSPNQPDFPSAVLKPGETYRHVMVHKFSAK